MNIPTIALNDGSGLPAVGFGTCKLTGSKGAAAIASALGNGYRLLDSAFAYDNEGAVAQAIRRACIPRDQVLFTSKLPGRHYAYEDALACIEESLFRTQLDALDLYLLHWPNPAQGLYVEAWEALVEARRRGWVKSIGVCNFLPEHLYTLIEQTGVTPAVNQIELHPYFAQENQLAWNHAHGIVTQAWSPIGRGTEVQRDPLLQRLADKYERSVIQVILRWHVQLGSIALPKAASTTRQRENIAVFDFQLCAQDMAAISALSKPQGRLLGQDPATYEEL